MNIFTLCDKIELQLYMKKRVNSNIMIPVPRTRMNTTISTTNG